MYRGLTNFFGSGYTVWVTRRVEEQVRAARWFGPGDVRVVDVPDPAPGAADVVVDVAWCGICRTDLEEYLHGPVSIPVTGLHPLTGRRAPVTLGHEFAGTVASVGSGTSTLTVGTPVTVEAALSCGRCPYCRDGEPPLCTDWATIGLHADGGLAEQVVVPEANCLPLPESLTLRDAALVEPTEVAVRAVAKAGIREGQTVAVVGGGTVGLLVLQVARAAGVRRAYVIEPLAARRALASRLGATACLDPGEPDWAQRIVDSCGGPGPHVVFECAGAPGTLDVAVRLARKGGRVVLVAIYPEPVRLDALDLLVGEKQLVGTVQHQRDTDLQRAVDLLAHGVVDVRPLVTDTVPLCRAVEGGLDALAKRPDRHLKILVGPGIEEAGGRETGRAG